MLMLDFSNSITLSCFIVIDILSLEIRFISMFLLSLLSGPPKRTSNENLPPDLLKLAVFIAASLYLLPNLVLSYSVSAVTKTSYSLAVMPLSLKISGLAETIIRVAFLYSYLLFLKKFFVLVLNLGQCIAD